MMGSKALQAHQVHRFAWSVFIFKVNVCLLRPYGHLVHMQGAVALRMLKIIIVKAISRCPLTECALSTDTPRPVETSAMKHKASRLLPVLLIGSVYFSFTVLVVRACHRWSDMGSHMTNIPKNSRKRKDAAGAFVVGARGRY